MREKGFRLLAGLVMITATTGCDNVAFGGLQVELLPPSLPPGSAPVEAEEPAPEVALQPIELGSVLYLVERLDGSRASIVPIAELDDDGYRALPEGDVPEFVTRFPLRRWDQGMELSLFAQGMRTGTFIADGTAAVDDTFCQPRPLGAGRIELLPEAATYQRFLAMERDATPSTGAAAPLVSGLEEDSELRAAALNLAQRLIPEMGVVWPSSIPDIRRDLQPVVLDVGGPPGLAVSFVNGDSLAVGPTTPIAYSLFIVAEETPERYEPIFAWHQRYDDGGKAFPRYLAAHDAQQTGTSDVLVEVFGESARWLAILGLREGSWGVVFEDDCGVPAAASGLRTFP